MATESQSLDGCRLVFYTDAKGYGGHDIQSLHALQCFLEAGAKVACFYRESTELWAQALKKLKARYDFEIHPLRLPNVRFHRSYHFFNPCLTRSLGKQLSAFRPDAAFISQGNLEISALGALAARKARIPSLSYIALAHNFRELKANRAARRDFFNQYLATVPSRWLTISESMRERLRERGARQPIDLMPNLVEVPKVPTRAEARQQLGLPEDALVLGMTGRLEPKQKGTDVFVRAMTLAPQDHPLRTSWIFLLGDGAGRESMIRELETAGWRGRLVWKPWVEEPWNCYPAYDLLAAPSYFEGLPIAVQEVVLCGIPVAASNVDGLGEFLPQSWTCEPGDPQAFLQILDRYCQAPEAYRQLIPELISQIREDFSRKAAHKALLSSFSKLLHRKNDIADSLQVVDS